MTSGSNRVRGGNGDRGARAVRPRRRRPFRALRAAAALLTVAASAAPSLAGDPVRLRVVGGVAGVTQFTQFEEPFWSKRIGEVSGGRIEATVHAFDRSGLRGPDMLQMMRLGVVPFGTVLVAIAAGEEPELNAVDLPILNPNMETLRRTVAAYRPHLRRVLEERYGIELLGIYAYPAQVVYCATAFGGLDDLAGRRVRTSSVGQSELVSALGGTPVLTPFAETVDAVANGVVDCAITGTLSGHEIGLSAVTTHIHAMAVSWGLSVFGANQAAWGVLPPDLQEVVRRGVDDLERQIWDAADRETARGLACNVGSAECAGPARRNRLTLVPVTSADEAKRRRLLVEAVLPRWIDRCGPPCVSAWNETLAPVLGIKLGRD